MSALERKRILANERKTRRIAEFAAMRKLTQDQSVLNGLDCLERRLCYPKKWHGPSTVEAIEKAKQEKAAKQKATAVEAKNKYQRWTRREIEVLTNSDLEDDEIASMLGRTLYAVGTYKTKMRRKNGLMAESKVSGG